MTDIENVKTAAEEASKPGKFSFIDRVTGREYPTKAVEIYLDERAGLKIQELLREHSNATDAKTITRIEKDLELWRKKAQESRYTVHLEGIPVEAWDKIVDDANEQFPIEYRESRHPLTMELERNAIENDDHDTYFRTQVWSKFIRKVEDAKGNVDDTISPAFVAVMMGGLPITAQILIQDGVDELRMITDWMDNIQGDDFLAKS